MSQVEIAGKLMHAYGPAQGTPWAGATIDIQYHGYSQTPTEQRPSDRYQLKTLADGTWKISLFKNADGDYRSYYTFQFPNNRPIKITIAASTPATIGFSELALNNTPADSPDYPSLIALINTQLAGSGLSLPAGGAKGQALTVSQESPRLLEWATQDTTFTQSVAADTWTFNHTLNKVPNITVTDLAGNCMLVETQVTTTQAIVKSNSPITGLVHLS